MLPCTRRDLFRLHKFFAFELWPKVSTHCGRPFYRCHFTYNVYSLSLPISFLFPSSPRCFYIRITYVVHLFLPRNESITDFYVESLIGGVTNGIFKSETTAHLSSVEMVGKKHKIHKTMNDHSTRDDIKRKQQQQQQQFMSNASPSHTSNGRTSSSLPSSSSSVGRVLDESGTQLPNDFGHRTNEAHQPNDNRISFNNSVTRRNKRIKMSNYHIDHCNQDFWSETIQGQNPNESLVRKWSFNGKIGNKNKTVSFRWVTAAGELESVWRHAMVE